MPWFFFMFIRLLSCENFSLNLIDWIQFLYNDIDISIHIYPTFDYVLAVISAIFGP